MKKEWFESPWIVLFPIIVFLIFPAWYTGSQYFLVNCNNFGNKESPAVCAPVELDKLFVTAIDVPEPDPEKEAVKGWKASEKLAPDVKPRRQGGRFIWMFAFVAVIMTAAAGLLIALFVIQKYTGAVAPRKKIAEAQGLLAFLLEWRTLIFGILMCVIGTLIVVAYPEKTELIYKKTIANHRTDGIANFVRLMEFIYASSYAALLALASAMLVLAFPRKNERVIRETAEEDQDEDSYTITFKTDEVSKKYIKNAAAVLLRKRDALNSLLYVSTILLVLTVVRMHASYSWTLTFMSAESVPGMKIFYENFATVLGGFFTLLLASTYIPIAYIVNSRGRTAQRAEWQGTADAGKKTAETDFKFSFNEAFPKILAIIAPLLTGPLAEFFKNSMPK